MAPDITSADLRQAIRRSVATLSTHLRLCRGDPILLIYAELHERALAFIAEREQTAQRPSELDELAAWLIQIAAHWRLYSKRESRKLRQIVNCRALLVSSARSVARRQRP